jgi:two-component system CheB/CheR fusion protein
MNRRNTARMDKRKLSPTVAVVGMGASAGGLEAFINLLKALSPDTGMAFVLISHLMHEQKSILSELLSKATSMPVTQLDRNTLVQPNHVYVIPPDKEISVRNGYLRVTPPTTVLGPPKVIDTFFRSLAKVRKDKAIGVILSGTGSDGTIGLADIKSEGGLTFVQAPETAAYDDMPRSAQSSADYVLPPEQIANELNRIACHPYVSEATPIEPAPGNNLPLKQIFRLVQESGGVDFSHYKPGTVRRRIMRRMVFHKIDSLPKYLEELRADKDELAALYQDLLITVTEFFRDPETFEFLKKSIIPHILNSLPEDTPARVWVPGCASGEEVYSIAMCFIEVAKDRTSPPVRIFGTDVSQQCIENARRCVYSDKITTNVSPERLGRFFVKQAGGYRIARFVRDLCIFAIQDVIKDPPFSRMDLLSCRNLLIYLDTPTQKEVLRRFHYALRPDGFLLLGATETVNASPELFEQVHRPGRVYSRVPLPGRLEFPLSKGVWKLNVL